MNKVMGIYEVLQKAKVKYSMSSFNGVISVYCFREDTEEIIFLRAREALKRVIGELPDGYENGVVVSRVDLDEKDLEEK